VNKIVIGVIFVVAAIWAVHASADGKKKKKISKPGWDPYSCCHNMVDTPGRPMVVTENYLVPEFYFFDTLVCGDTAFVYECYDREDSIVDADTLHDFGVVHNITYFKKFTDKAHTYKDSGKEKPLPVSLIVRRYERLAKDKWMCISYPGNKYEELREYKNEFVHVDTVRNSYPDARLTVVGIYRYYKVAALQVKSQK
jgi:hypothetical protein